MRNKFSYPVETGRELNVHKTFRRRPGRLRLQNTFCAASILSPSNYKNSPLSFEKYHSYFMTFSSKKFE